jgi:CubicO group peptidase (beta-lactamase class C family)
MHYLLAARRAAALLATLTAAALPAAAQSAPSSDSAALGAATDRVFAEYDRPASPGCALAVYRDGRIVYARGYGAANLELDTPITPRTVFDIGSTSKQFTAMSVLLLAQDGKLSLDDEVRKHVPELPDYGRPITIRHLLHHTSGLRDYLELLALTGARTEDVTGPDDALAIIVRQRALNFEPGSEWLYSNTGFFLLSVIVERASGKSLAAFARERIFEPLGMRDTHFHDDHTMVVPRRATGYAPKEGGGVAIEMSDWEQTGDGAVFTTVEDLLRWDENFYSGRIGGRQLLDEMQRTARLNGGKPLSYAAGLWVDHYRGLRTVSHGGSWAGYRAELLRFPDQHLSVACLCNLATADPSTLAQRVADAHLADRMAAAEARTNGARPALRAPATRALPPLSARDTAELIGVYEEAGGSIRRVLVREGKLVSESDGRVRDMERIGPREFRLVGASGGARLAFEPARGQARRLRLLVDGEPPRAAEAVAVVRPTATQLAEYVGTYDSDEIGSPLAIAIDSGALVLRGRNLPRDPFVPLRADEFTTGYYRFRFERGADGRVAGFVLDLGRIRNLKYVRPPG